MRVLLPPCFATLLLAAAGGSGASEPGCWQLAWSGEVRWYVADQCHYLCRRQSRLRHTRRHRGTRRA